jgi:hypothetical protein
MINSVKRIGQTNMCVIPGVQIDDKQRKTAVFDDKRCHRKISDILASGLA